MSERQNVEWKESWRDEYLKWVCGFANAQGGVLEIGKNDSGDVVGIPDAKRLLEELPNKMRDLLGIIADVDLEEEDGKEYIRITVEPYPYPVSYRGSYHYRSGSTKQVLKGAALDRFLLSRTGKRWDSVPVPSVRVSDLDSDILQSFRERAAKSKRLDPAILEENDTGLIEKLRLTDGEHLKRAAILLFHPDPEQFITGAFVKIGHFESNSELLYHDEVHGDLFTQIDKSMDLLLTKYLKASIEYEGVQRVESYPVPVSALRETLLNALAHKDYSSGVPIQISVYDDRILFWNNGQLPDEWTVESLKTKHPSQPYNPDIANALFRAGMIEAWGRGIEKIIQACLEWGALPPDLRYVEPGLWVEFTLKDQAGTKQGLSRDQAIVLRKCLTSQSIKPLQESVGRSNRTKFRDQVLMPLITEELVEMTLPEKPTSPKQEYRITDKGRAVLNTMKTGDDEK